MKVTEQDLRAIKGLRLSLRGGTTFIYFYLEELEQRIKLSLGQDKSCKKRRADKCEIKFSANNWTTGNFVFNEKSYGFALDIGPYQMFSYSLMKFNNNYMTKMEAEAVRRAFRAAKKNDETILLMEILANEYFLFLHRHMYVGAEQVIALYGATGFTFLDAGNFTDKTKDTFINVDISSFNFENKCSCLDNSLGSHIYSVAFVDKFIEFANGVRIGFR